MHDFGLDLGLAGFLAGSAGALLLLRGAVRRGLGYLAVFGWATLASGLLRRDPIWAPAAAGALAVVFTACWLKTRRDEQAAPR